NEKKRIKSISHRVKHLQNVSTETLNLLYNSAFCLVYPSSYEGFGIPILEAMKAGCPVVSTNTSSIPEDAEEAALLVNETSAEKFKTKINQLFNISFRNKLVQISYLQENKFSKHK